MISGLVACACGFGILAFVLYFLYCDFKQEIYDLNDEYRKDDNLDV